MITRTIGDVLDADVYELLGLAQTDRKNVVIQVESKPAYMHNVAFSMARTIDEDTLDEDKANRIIRILSGEGE